MLIRTFLSHPEMYVIRDHYPELWRLYKKNVEYMAGEIAKFSESEFNKQFEGKSVEFGLLFTEIVDCALRTQERFLQDFKFKPKGPIANQLIYYQPQSGNGEKSNATMVDLFHSQKKDSGE